MSQSNNATFNDAFAELQKVITRFDENAQATREELLLPLEKTHVAIKNMIGLAHNRALENFLETIARAVEELYLIAQSNEDNPGMERPKAILQYLAALYQDTIVPMLTRLHNLATDSDGMLKITTLATLGNEIMTCSNQIYQFSVKMETTEKIYGMLGIVLMMAGIGLTITILSDNNTGTTTIVPLTLITLGSILCGLSIKQHDKDPEVDLARKAVLNTDKSIQSSKEILLEPSEFEEDKLIIRITKQVEELKETKEVKTKVTANVSHENAEEKTIKVEVTLNKEQEEDTQPSNSEDRPAGLSAKFKSAFSFIKNFNPGSGNTKDK